MSLIFTSPFYMQSISILLSRGLKYFPLRVILKIEKFPSLTTCDMLVSGEFTSFIQVRRLSKRKKKIQEKL